MAIRSLGALNHHDSVEVVGDTEVTIDIAHVRISGRVIAADTREPVSGAEVSAEVEGTSGMPLGGNRVGTSVGGEFELFVPAGGRVLLRALAPGRAEGDLTIDTASGTEISGVEIELGQGEGLDLDVALWSGLRPDLVSTALIDAAGNRILADALMGRPAGKFRMTSAPPGEWTLLVAANESAVVARKVTVPEAGSMSVQPSGASGSRSAASAPGQSWRPRCPSR